MEFGAAESLVMLVLVVLATFFVCQKQLKNQKHALESDQRRINQENDQLKSQIDQMRQSFDDHLGLVLP